MAIPRYQQVAADIASKIADKQYQVGEKIYARSLIASQYSVSSETARRAIALLSNMGIVEAIKGSGVVIISYENALRFLRQNVKTETLTNLRRAALVQANQLSKESLELKEKIDQMVDLASQFQSTNPFVPYETMVESESVCVGKSLSDLRFWDKTFATVVAIRREGTLILSPCPYEQFQADDIICFIGNEECWDLVMKLLYG